MAKTVKPEIKKSAAKRAETKEQQAARFALTRQLKLEGFPAVKKHANALIAALKEQFAEVDAGRLSEEQCTDIVIAMARAFVTTKKKQGYVFE